MNNIRLIHKHPYYSQVQAEMGAFQRCWCDFFVYSRHGYYLERIFFDESYWQEIDEASELFFLNWLTPELIAQACALITSPMQCEPY